MDPSFLLIASVLAMVVGWSLTLAIRLPRYRTPAVVIVALGLAAPTVLALTRVQANPGFGSLLLLGVLSASVGIGAWLGFGRWTRRKHPIAIDTLEQLFETAPEGIVLLDPDDRVVQCNAYFTRMFRYTRDEVVGRRINDLIVPEELKDEGRDLTLAVAGGRPLSTETIRQAKDGSKIEVSILATPYRSEDGETAVYGIYRDITDRRAAEEAFRKSEERYRSVLDSITDGYYEVDLTGTFLSCNEACARILGRPHDKVIGATHRDFMDTASAKRVYVAFNRIANTGEALPHFDCSIRRPTGERRHIEGSAAPVMHDGRITAFRGIVTDVTERMDAEEATRRLWSAIETSIDGVAILDGKQRFIYVNDAQALACGYSSTAAFLGNSWELLCAPESLEHFRGSVLPALRAKGKWSGESIGVRSDGSTFPQELSLTYSEDIGYACIIRNISERKDAQTALQKSEERYALAARAAASGLWDWDLQSNRIYFAPRWLEQIGLTSGDVDSTPSAWFDRVHPDDIEELQNAIRAHLTGETPHFENEHRMEHQDGSYRWMLTRGKAVNDGLGKPTRMAGSQTDITGRREIEEQLQHDAMHDALTGLPNRALLTDRLSQALHRVRRHPDDGFAVMFIDLDRFKVINDSLGHQAGDRLLVAVAERLAHCIRPGDTIARIGGDEFVLVLNGVGEEQATQVAERIHQSLEHPLDIDAQEVFTTASIGITLNISGDKTPEELLRDADAAMYRAKAMGQAKHAIFNLSMHQHAVDRLKLESDLRRAAERNEFRLHYQPIVQLETGKLYGMEALLRWHRRDVGLVCPNDFIPVAEETGLIVDIGRQALTNACEQMQRWRDEYPAMRDVIMHVNLSGRQFAQETLVEQVAKALTSTGLPAEFLGLEITESVVMDDAELAAKMLAQLRHLNVRLQIDDFGTGYSSLSYLTRFPVDTLKIDRSFVMGATDENAKVIRSVTALSRDLQMDVIAEGIESEAQIELLRNVGCALGQGNYLVPAAPVEDLIHILKRGTVEIPNAATPRPERRRSHLKMAVSND